MGPILKLTPMPMNKKGEPVKANQIAAGSTISATFLSGRGIAMWGAGLGTNFRVPTPIKVRYYVLRMNSWEYLLFVGYYV